MLDETIYGRTYTKYNLQDASNPDELLSEGPR